MVKTCDSLISQCMDYCDELVRLAQNGMSACDDEACMLFFGLVLDSAYKLKTANETRCRDLSAGYPGPFQDQVVLRRKNLTRASGGKNR